MVVTSEYKISKNDWKTLYNNLFFRFLPKWAHYLFAILWLVVISTSKNSVVLLNGNWTTRAITIILPIYIIALLVIEYYILRSINSADETYGKDRFVTTFTEGWIESTSSEGRNGKTLLSDMKGVILSEQYLIMKYKTGIVGIMPTTVFQSLDDILKVLEYFRNAGVNVKVRSMPSLIPE